MLLNWEASVVVKFNYTDNYIRRMKINRNLTLVANIIGKKKKKNLKEKIEIEKEKKIWIFQVSGEGNQKLDAKYTKLL